MFFQVASQLLLTNNYSEVNESSFRKPMSNLFVTCYICVAHRDFSRKHENVIWYAVLRMKMILSFLMSEISDSFSTSKLHAVFFNLFYSLVFVLFIFYDSAFHVAHAFWLFGLH